MFLRILVYSYMRGFLAPRVAEGALHLDGCLLLPNKRHLKRLRYWVHCIINKYKLSLSNPPVKCFRSTAAHSGPTRRSRGRPEGEFNYMIS